VAAGFGHFFYFFPSLFLRFVAHAILDTLPFLKEKFHLKVIEDGLAEGIDAAEQDKFGIRGGGDHTIEDDPFAAFAEIVFQLYD